MHELTYPVLALTLSIGLPVSAGAESTPECPATVTPPGELAPWAAPVMVNSANEASELPDAELRVGQAAELILHPIGAVALPIPPGRSGGQGGLAAVTIERSGNYRVALGTAGWVDLVRDGKAVTSTAHGHGPRCTGIRKMVDFALKRGRYTVTISGNLESRTQVLVARLP